MPLASPTALLGLALSTAPAEPSRPLECAQAQRVELDARPSNRPPEVCVSPGEPTHFLFDTQFRPGGVELAERDSFLDVAEGRQSVTLYPSERVVSGKPLTLTACFVEGVAPACATFLLVPTPGQATREVTVVRRPRPEADLQRELTRQEALVAQLQAQLARTQAECQGPPGLRSLLAQGLLRDGEAIKGADITRKVRHKVAGARLHLVKVVTYTARGRVAIAVSLKNGGSLPWEPGNAHLRTPLGASLTVLPVWPREPLLPGTSTTVVVEATTPEEAAPPGPFVLTLEGKDGQQFQLGNVTFP